MSALRNLGGVVVAAGIVLLVLSPRDRERGRRVASQRIVDRDGRDSANAEQARDALRQTSAT